MSHDFALDIAGVLFLVRLPERRWLAPLAARYTEFTVPSAALAGEASTWDAALVHAASRSDLACCGPSGAGKTTRARLATGHAAALTAAPWPARMW